MKSAEPPKPRSLRKELTLVVAVKLLFIFVFWMVCFSHPATKIITNANVVQRMLTNE